MAKSVTKPPQGANKPAAKPASGKAPVKPTGKAPAAKPAAKGPEPKPLRRRRGNYDYASHGASRDGLPMDDRTIKPGANVDLHRPDFKSKDSLIFRALPCLEDEPDINLAKFMPYRKNIKNSQFNDWIRTQPAAKYVGLGDEKITFLLYDKAEAEMTGYDRRQNPYIILYNSIYNAVEKDFTAPDVSWGKLIKGKHKALAPPTNLTYMQGLIYVKGSKAYFGGGKPPLGAGRDDKAQIIQLTKSAGEELENGMNRVNPDWTGNPNHFEHSMFNGDITHPKFGRFIRISNPKAGTGAATIEDDSGDWDMNAERGKGGRKEDKEFAKYDVYFDKQLTVGGQVLKAKPSLADNVMEALKPKIVFWDEVLYVPSHDEIVVMLAKVFKGARAVLEFAWADHPEFFTDEVNSILDNATQVMVGESVPDHRKGRSDEPAWNDGSDEEAPAPARGRRSSVVPAADDEYNYADDGAGEVEGEEGEEGEAEGEVGEEGADYDYGDADPEAGEEGDEAGEGEEAAADDEAEYGEEGEDADAEGEEGEEGEEAEGGEGEDDAAYDYGDSEEGGEEDAGEEGEGEPAASDESEYEDETSAPAEDDDPDALAALEQAQNRSANRSGTKPPPPRTAPRKHPAAKPAAAASSAPKKGAKPTKGAKGKKPAKKGK